MDPSRQALMQLKINRQMLSEFLEGIETYEFQIDTFPAEFNTKMSKKDFLFHFYGVIQNYVVAEEQETELTLCKIMVLYAVSSFKQKAQTNAFIVSFLLCLDKLFVENPEVEFVVELINAFCDDKALMKNKLKYACAEAGRGWSSRTRSFTITCTSKRGSTTRSTSWWSTATIG